MKVKNIISDIILIVVIIFALKPVYDIQIVSKESQAMEIERFFSNFDMTKNKTKDTNKNVSKYLLETKGVLYVPSIDLKLPIYEGTSETAISEGTGLIENSGTLSGTVGECPIITSHNGISNKNLFLNLNKMKKGDIYYIFENREKIHEYEVVDVRVLEPVDEYKNLYTDRDKALSTLRTCTPTGINSHRLLVTGEKIKDVNAVALDTSFKFSNLSRFEMLLIGIASLAYLILMYDITKEMKKYVLKRREKKANNNGTAVTADMSSVAE